MSNFDLLKKEYALLFDEYAKNRFNSFSSAHPTLVEAMKYSFFAGGKRVRPVLSLATADMLGLDRAKVLPFAFALECIHTYSLIHDDLPAMDNDDYRRGRLTSHKVYGEAMAILAGDALLNLAFSVSAEQCVENPSLNVCKTAKYLADCAGQEGMISGQVYDILSEINKVKDESVLYSIEVNKTAKLIMAAIVMPGILADADVTALEEISLKLGVQFQIVDDLLDVVSNFDDLGKSIGKDEASGKLTYVTLFGVEKAKLKIKELAGEITSLLSKYKNNTFLTEFCNYLSDRIN